MIFAILLGCAVGAIILGACLFGIGYLTQDDDLIHIGILIGIIGLCVVFIFILGVLEWGANIANQWINETFKI